MVEEEEEGGWTLAPLLVPERIPMWRCTRCTLRSRSTRIEVGEEEAARESTPGHGKDHEK